MPYPTRRLAHLRLVAAAAMLATVLPASGVSAASLSITSGDGVGLRLRPDASVAAMKLGTRALSMVGGGGFSLRNVGGMPNLVPNGSFETDADSDGVPDGWSARFGPPATLSSSVAHTGRRSVRAGRTTNGDSGAFLVEVSVLQLTEYTISAWMRGDDMKPTAPTALTYGAKSPVRVLVQQLVGSTLLVTESLYGYSDTAGWNRQFLGVRTLPGVTTIRITARILGGSGTAWFDDINLSQLFKPGRAPIRGHISSAPDGSLRQHADIPSQHLSFDATYAAGSDRITVDATVRNTSATDLPVEVSYTLPFRAVGWRWADYARRSHDIASDATYAYDTKWGVQSMSRYPWSTVGDARSSLSIGIPLSMPRIARVSYGPAGLTISFDLGLSRHATLLGNAATFRFVLFTSDPAWGFRASTAKYYALYPGAFVRRTDPAREGGWAQRSSLGPWADQMADFGLGMDVLGLGSGPDGAEDNDSYLLPADNAEGVYATAYNHHWGYKFGIDPAEIDPTYSEAITLLKATAMGPRDTEQERRHADRAKAALVSATRDYNGRLLYEEYLGKLLQYYENLDPVPDARIDAARSGHDLQVLVAIASADAVPARLDAIHFDSTAGMRRWAAQDDYSHSHWAVAREPLTFSYDSGLVVDRIAFTDFGQIQREADYLHDRGMILTANFNGSEARAGAWFGADKIDYFGLEQGLPEKTGGSDPYVTQDSFAMFKRTLAYHRPVTTYDMRIGLGELSTAEIERRLQLNLFYGIYAGIGGGGGGLTEGIRQRYLRYVPIFRAIDTVGWEPVTLARSDDPKVWLERYGNLASGPLYLAIRNETEEARRYTASVDLRGNGGPAGQLLGREMVDDKAVTVRVRTNGQAASFSGTVAAGSTQVVRITTAP